MHSKTSKIIQCELATPVVALITRTPISGFWSINFTGVSSTISSLQLRSRDDRSALALLQDSNSLEL
jgi:hypothetical protein